MAVKFEFGHVGINAQTEEEGKRMKDFFTDVMGYDDYREIPASYFTNDNRMELMKKMGKGTMGHLGFFVNDIPEAIAYLESKGYELDYSTARYAE
ncbi:MAG TPA: 2-dehydro-3-deoxyphosphogluconate aldolase, partial [Erysipelotrichaceae bacterium]|nr:2-dehydro-3-deoxyphosphogluconate aldolase [Erysipelotrichaceae bacterium]